MTTTASTAPIDVHHEAQGATSVAELIAAGVATLGKSQRSIAETLGVTQQTVSKWRRDVTLPQYGQLAKIATVLSINENELEASWLSDERARSSGVSADVALLRQAGKALGANDSGDVVNAALKYVIEHEENAKLKSLLDDDFPNLTLDELAALRQTG